jgi:hypothetical protein
MVTHDDWLFLEDNFPLYAFVVGTLSPPFMNRRSSANTIGFSAMTGDHWGSVRVETGTIVENHQELVCNVVLDLG